MTGGTAGFQARIRAQADALCALGAILSEPELVTIVPGRLLSNDDVMVDEPVPVMELIIGLATAEITARIRQLQDLLPKNASTKPSVTKTFISAWMIATRTPARGPSLDNVNDTAVQRSDTESVAVVVRRAVYRRTFAVSLTNCSIEGDAATVHLNVAPRTLDISYLLKRGPATSAEL